VARANKPYGIYGITFPGTYGFAEERLKYNPKDIELMSNARFCYFRDSVSLAFAQKNGLKCEVTGFCPDGAFAIDVRNDDAAKSFLNEHGLEAGKYVCVIPQYRFSPWWEIPAKKTAPNAQKIAWNNQWKEHDNAPIRDAMIAVARNTDLKLLIVPKMPPRYALAKKCYMTPCPTMLNRKRFGATIFG
jgi:hypothetical protein